MSITPKYKTGILWQDFQHQKLFDLLDTLKKSRNDGNGTNTVTYAISFLAMYVNDHFSLEESYMREYNYPDVDYHVQEHGEFIARFRELRNKYTEHTEDTIDILVSTISEWIKTHITHNDINLGKFIVSKERSKYISG